MSQTIAFIERPGILRKNKDNGLTHTLLDGYKGGKVMVPDELFSSFLSAYATDVANGVPLYVNELRRVWFRMFLDLDIMHEQQLSASEVEEIVCMACECFRRFYPEYKVSMDRNKFLAIVSDACPKSICSNPQSLIDLLQDAKQLGQIVDDSLPSDDAIDIDYDASIFKDRIWDVTYKTVFRLPDGRLFQNTHRENGKLKHGIHVVFPHLIVNTEYAMYMREALVAALTKKFDTKYAEKGWHQVVDNAVYVSSGLRMIYSQKTQICQVCKKKNTTEGCGNCKNGKLLVDGRPYVFKFACLDGKIDEATTELLKNNIRKLIDYAIIRSDAQPPKDKPKEGPAGWKMFDGCPTFGKTYEIKDDRPPKHLSKEPVFPEEKKTLRTWKSKITVTDARIIELLQSQIRTRFVKEYRNVRVASIVRDDNMYYVALDGEGRNFCLNLNPPRDHKSNRVWASVTMEGISMRCFCACPTTEGRYLGMCKNFKTPARQLNRSQLALLFPEKQSSNPLFGRPSQFIDSIEANLFASSSKKRRL